MSIHDAKIKLEENKRATSLMSEFLNKPFLKTKQSWLVNTISNICSRVERTLKPTNLKFDVSAEAADHNAKIFMENGNNLQNVMNVNYGTSMTPGSEFRQITSIKEILGFHRDWTGIHATITKGCTYPIENVISPEDQKTDLEYMMKFGNHKSASSPEGKEIVEKAYINEVAHHWMFPMPIDSLQELDGAGVIPIGREIQQTLDEKGHRKVKN